MSSNQTHSHESEFKDSKIYVAGHKGFVGSAVVRSLKRHGYKSIVIRDRADLNLSDKMAVRAFFESERPRSVILAAAKVGGIGANNRLRVEFLLENLEIQNHIISAAADFGVEKLVFLGSSCIYPKQARYPITEDQLLSGPFEPTNEPYALAKVAGIKLCEAYFEEYGKRFISLMPTNVFGPNERFDSENSHVIPSMMCKVFKAMQEKATCVTFWGTGKPLRELIHSDDLADGVVVALENWEKNEIVNIGSGQEYTIADIAHRVCKACGYQGDIRWDSSRPDGVFRKVMDSTKIRSLGWIPSRTLDEGLEVMAREAKVFLGG